MEWLNGCEYVTNNSEMWGEVVSAPFFAEIAEDKLPSDTFRNWLIEEFWIARQTLDSQAEIIAKTPRPTQKVLIGGLSALSSQLDWFEKYANQRILNLLSEPNSATLEYVEFLRESAASSSFQKAIPILFARESIRLAGWSSIHRNNPLIDFIEYWSSPRFVAYVQALKDTCTRNPHLEQQSMFAKTVKHELPHWNVGNT